MIPSGLFSQIALIILSIGIIFTYIKPAFGDITALQEQISVYQEERGKVASVNASLEQKLQIIDTVFSADKDRLVNYLPDLIDPLVVMRDIDTIADLSGVIVSDVVDNGPVEEAIEESIDPYAVYDPYAPVVDSLSGGPYAYSFALTVNGSYNQLKDLVELLEQNNYPLEIRELNIQASEGGFLNGEFLLYSYSLNQTNAEDVELFQDVNVTYE